MVSLRHFTADDADVIKSKIYPDLPPEDIFRVLREWSTYQYQGKFFEMFAIESEGRIVGSISLFDKGEHIASIGIEVFPDERRKGFAAEAMDLISQIARGRGYEVLLDQIRTDNAASLSLHKKLGFEDCNVLYRNSKGNEVVQYIKIIV